MHKRESQICVLSESGELVLERRIQTTRERITAVLGRRGRAKVLIEASTESEWVARCIEGLGHEVVVADPNFSAMYASRSRKVKTDRRDARTLAEACRLGAYRQAHRASDTRRHVRAQLAVREVLVRTRAKYVALGGALLSREGFRVGSGSAQCFPRLAHDLQLPGELLGEVAPLLSMIVQLNHQITWMDDVIECATGADGDINRLKTVPYIGTIRAAAFVATIDDAQRFTGAHQVESYLGLVPSELSSGEKQRRGRITKAGSGRVRWLLVEAAWSMLWSRKPEVASLREWARRIAARRCHKVAVVALARRLAGIMYALMRDQASYDHARLTTPKEANAIAA